MPSYLYDACFFRSHPGHGARFASATSSMTSSLTVSLSVTLCSSSSATVSSEMVGSEAPAMNAVDDVHLLLLLVVVVMVMVVDVVVSETAIKTSSNIRRHRQLQHYLPRNTYSMPVAYTVCTPIDVLIKGICSR